jgi:uncharacterized protein
MKFIKLQKSLVLILTFIISFYGNKVSSEFININFMNKELKIIYYYLWWVLPTLLSLGLLFNLKSLTECLGLKNDIIQGLVYSIVFVLPMLLGSSIIGSLIKDLSITDFLQKTLLAGFMEEYLFRGFLFGILFLRLGWGFVPSSVLGAIIFGFGHVYQGNNFVESLGVFIVTASGAVWFAWLYIEWENNLWIPVFLHSLMNLSWLLFDISENALGSALANFFRVITIVLSIVLTVNKNKKNGMKINTKNLLINSINN